MLDLQEVVDRLAIRDLIERYTVSVTVRDWDGVADCFEEEACWQVAPPMGREFRNREGIRDGLREAVEPSEFLFQMTHSVLIDDLTDDTARATVVINEIAGFAAPQRGFFLLGIYEDRIRKREGRWRFSRRLFTRHYVDTNWLPSTAATGGT